MSLWLSVVNEKTQSLVLYQQRNVHFHFRKNQSVGSKAEMAKHARAHAHTIHDNIATLIFLLFREESRLKLT
jgi:mannosyltransferase OCH1-like enzyme